VNATPVDQQAIQEAASAVRQRVGVVPTVGVILGSGLGGLSDGIRDGVAIPYAQIPHMPPATVQGHKGDLIIGRLGERGVAVLNGRLHFYEGYSLQQTTFPVRILKALGCHTLIVTNAAGGLDQSLRVGDLMLISDHINLPGLAGHNPLFGPNDPHLGPRFPDLHNAYDRDLRKVAKETARGLGFVLREGIYVMLGGPSFETPAEVRMLRSLGGDAVGMSTVAEVIVARHGGQRVLGISTISNVLSPQAEAEPVNHEEVLAAGAVAVQRLVPLLTGVIARL
jgi:purine-nucleoside phosphorylase